jgi:putative hemolysin
LAPYAHSLALGIVVVMVSYLTLVLGELVPKSFALRHAEAYSLRAARPLLALSWLMRPLVWLLTKSSNLLLRPFGDRTTFTEARLSPEELQQLVEEAAKTGVLDQHAGEIASRALDFGQLTVGEVMVPRNRIDALPKTASADDIKRIMLETGHSRMPVYEGALDNIVGYITAKDVLALAWEGRLVVVHDLIRPALFLPETAKATQVLEELQRQRMWLAFVVDEHGGLAGLVTLEDLIEELVGEIFSEHDEPVELVKKEPGGSALVAGVAPIRDVNRDLALDLPEEEGSFTMAGLCTALAGRIPKKGTRLTAKDGTVIEVIEASARVVRLVRVIGPQKPKQETPGTEGPSERGAG